MILERALLSDLESGKNSGVLKSAIGADKTAVGTCFRKIGEMKACVKMLEEAEREILSRADIETIKECLGKPPREWPHVTRDDLGRLEMLSKLLRSSSIDFLEQRTELIRFRKLVLSYIEKIPVEEADLVRSILDYTGDNYTFSDTMYAMGFDPEIDESGMFKMKRLTVEDYLKNY